MRTPLFLIVVLLPGCTIPNTAWQKDGATEQEFAKDTYECERDGRESGIPNDGLFGTQSLRDLMRRCMIARGWRSDTVNAGVVSTGMGFRLDR